MLQMLLLFLSHFHLTNGAAVPMYDKLPMWPSASSAQIQTGVVPIFDKRMTMEPITFTFTTPPSLAYVTPTPFPLRLQDEYASTSSFPTLRPNDIFEAPYVSMQSFAPPVEPNFDLSTLDSAKTIAFPNRASLVSSPEYSGVYQSYAYAAAPDPPQPKSVPAFSNYQKPYQSHPVLRSGLDSSLREKAVAPVALALKSIPPPSTPSPARAQHNELRAVRANIFNSWIQVPRGSSGSPPTSSSPPASYPSPSSPTSTLTSAPSSNVLCSFSGDSLRYPAIILPTDPPTSHDNSPSSTSSSSILVPTNKQPRVSKPSFPQPNPCIARSILPAITEKEGRNQFYTKIVPVVIPPNTYSYKYPYGASKPKNNHTIAQPFELNRSVSSTAEEFHWPQPYVHTPSTSTAKTITDPQRPKLNKSTSTAKPVTSPKPTEPKRSNYTARIISSPFSKATFKTTKSSSTPPLASTVKTNPPTKITKIVITIPEPAAPSISSVTPTTTPTPDEVKQLSAGLLNSFSVLKSALSESGVENEWRSFWSKLSGVVEPYLEQFTQHFGKAINIAIKQQGKNRKIKTHKNRLSAYESSMDDADRK